MAKALASKFPAPLFTAPPRRTFYWVLLFVSAGLLCLLPAIPLRAGVALLAGWVFLLWCALLLLRRQVSALVPLWLAFYPYCYYLFTFPREHSIFTVDRVFILLLMADALLSFRGSRSAISFGPDVRTSATFWFLFLITCFLSLGMHAPDHSLAFYRLLIEGMALPALLAFYAIRFYPLRENLWKLHSAACLLGFGLCVTGIIELTTDVDLFPWEGSAPMFTETHLRRADGPFEQQVVLSVVGILAFFFILYLRRVMPGKISARRSFIHRVGCFSCLAAALLPLNRGLIVSLLPIALIDCFSRDRLIRRRVWFIFFALIVAAAAMTRFLDPRLYEDRVTSPDNAYQRVAQHMETLHIISEYPFLGVGFGLYHDVASQNPQYMVRFNGIESMNFPHNVLMTVLSEEGAIGLALYVLAQVFLVRAMWKIRAASRVGWLTFLYCFLIYVLTGLDFAIVSFADINLLYMLILGLIFQYQASLSRQGLALERPSVAYAADPMPGLPATGFPT
jgi:hypothetical protein